MARVFAVCLLAFVAGAANAAPANHPVEAKQEALLQTWTRALDGEGSKGSAKDTPVTRVVKLLKEMETTLKKEMDEDEALYKELSCWCNDNNWEKGNAIEASEAKVQELETTIESLTAKSARLDTELKEVNARMAANKAALAEATKLREKQLSEFHGEELDSIQAIENLKAALVILSKHHGGAFPQISLSLIATGSKEEPLMFEPRSERSLDAFMDSNGYDSPATGTVAQHGFLQQEEPRKTQGSAADAFGWSTEDVAAVRKALKSASSFMQAHNGESYYPSYTAQSGEIVGVLKQLKEEMEGDLSEAQKREIARAKMFEELRAAKTSQIENNYKMSEQLEDGLAETDNALAEAKEDLEQEQASLSESQKFVKNLKETCADAEKNFEARKVARLEEIKAVGDTIEILVADEARDAMSGTYSFLQVSTASAQDRRRQEAASVLRRTAKQLRSPQLSMLASTVELDAFTRVKKAIDDMIARLKIEESDEVKKNDWCKKELQENEMATMKKEDLKADLEAKIAVLEETMKTLTQGIADAEAEISRLQVELQRASADRKAENLDYQKVVADQTLVIEVLNKALDRLATYYDKALFVQEGKSASKKQTPPVPQMEYKPNKGSGGVMELIEKLIHEARQLTADSKTGENAAQAAYETLVANTNADVKDLQREVVTKTKEKAQAKKDKSLTESDHSDTVEELAGLAKYNGELHEDCDYLLKNFGARQTARAQEIEALQQVKQILSGANMS